MSPVLQRLDRYIRRIYGENISQSVIEKAIRNKDILVNGVKVASNFMVSEQDSIFVHNAVQRLFSRYGTKDKRKTIENSARFVTMFEKSIIFEDDNFIIVNKPSGMAVQMGSKIHDSLDFIALAYNKDARLVHRIDKDTSGITIFAKNLQTSQYMLSLFQNKRIEKTYLAIVCGIPKIRNGQISAPLLKIPSKIVIDEKSGKESITNYVTISKLSENLCFLMITPETGRTHQIRVHMSSCLHSPILGDRKYGDKNQRFDKLCLHASEISFMDFNNRKIYVKAPLPDYMQDIIDKN